MKALSSKLSPRHWNTTSWPAPTPERGGFMYKHDWVYLFKIRLKAQIRHDGCFVLIQHRLLNYLHPSHCSLLPLHDVMDTSLLPLLLTAFNLVTTPFALTPQIVSENILSGDMLKVLLSEWVGKTERTKSGSVPTWELLFLRFIHWPEAVVVSKHLKRKRVDFNGRQLMHGWKSEQLVFVLHCNRTLCNFN